ncbi:MAG: hypothetical protein ABSH22_06715 [Tepidisphaeraceae bacterium]|jgi:hypothetical protein
MANPESTVTDVPGVLMLRICLVGFVATLATMFVSTIVGEHWEYFSIYSKMPVLVDQSLEFGQLFTPEPYAPDVQTGITGLTLGGPYSYQKHWPQLPAVETQTRTRWRFAGFQEQEGLLIPPWGWKHAPSYTTTYGFIEIFGKNPKTVIPFRVYRIPLFYLAVLFAIVPTYQFIGALRCLLV